MIISAIGFMALVVFVAVMPRLAKFHRAPH
jgi:hypothetical protein